MRLRVMTAALAVVTLFSPLTVRGAQLGVPYEQTLALQDDGAPEAEGRTVALCAEYRSTPPMLYLTMDGDVAGLELPDDIVIGYQGEEEAVVESWVYAEGVTWLTDDFDSSVPGLYTLWGAVQLPEGYVYYDQAGMEADLLIELPVTVTQGVPKKAVLRAAFYSKTTLLLLPVGGDPSTLDMPEDIVVLYGTGFRDFFIAPSVSWQWVQLDTQTPGRQMLRGIVELKDGYAWYDSDGQEADLIIEQPVLVYDPEAEPVEEVFTSGPRYGEATVMPVGCTQAEAEAVLTTDLISADRVMLETAEGYALDCGYRGDVSLIDRNTTGRYYPYVLDLPPCLSIADVAMEKLAAFVVDPSVVDVTATTVTGSSSKWLTTVWLYQAENPTAWYTLTSPVGEGAEPDWQPAEDARLSATSMDIPMYYVAGIAGPGNELWLQIRHGAGESNYIHLNLADMSFETVPIDGDRSGGDRDPGGSNTIPQPPDTEPPETEPPETEPPLTGLPGTQPPETEPPLTGLPGTQPPETEPPLTGLPGTQPPETERPRGVLLSPADVPPVDNRPADTRSEAALTVDELVVLQPSPQPTDSMPQGEGFAAPADDSDPQEGEPEPMVPDVTAAPDGERQEPDTPGVATAAQPVLVISAGAAAPSAPVSEVDIPREAITLSGDQLADLLTIHGDAVPFSWEAGTVWVPASVLALGRGEGFSVLLNQPALGQIQLSLWAGGQALTHTLDEPLELAIPWRGGEALCTDGQGTSLPCRLSDEGDVLLISVSRGGQLTLEPIVPVTTEAIPAAQETVVTAHAAVPPVAAAVMPQQERAAFPVAITGVLGVSGAGAAIALGRHTGKLRRRGRRP